MKREISKTPEAPKHLSDELRALLTELCFGTDVSIPPVELIFVYGTPYFIEDIANHITSLLSNNISKRVLITGGMMPHGESHIQKKSEAQIIYEKLSPDNFMDVEFFLEETSRNALDNVAEGLKVIDFRDAKSICFVFPAHGARRGLLTLKKFLPNTQIFQSPYDVSYSEDRNKISRDNWYRSESGTQRVWGEFLRIKTYGSRGDIAFDDETRKLVQSIDMALESSHN